MPVFKGYKTGKRKKDILIINDWATLKTQSAVQKLFPESANFFSCPAEKNALYLTQ